MGLLHFFPEGYQFTDLHGGMNLLAASYAIWNETTGFLIGTYLLDTYLLDLFKRKDVLRQWGNIGLYQYAAFLVHPVILGGVQAGSNRWKVGSGVMKSLVVGGIGVVGSWGVGWCLTKVDRVGML